MSKRGRRNQRQASKSLAHAQKKAKREEKELKRLMSTTCPNCDNSNDKTVHLLFGSKTAKDRTYGCAECWALWDGERDLVFFSEEYDFDLFATLAEHSDVAAPASYQEAVKIRRLKLTEAKDRRKRAAAASDNNKLPATYQQHTSQPYIGYNGGATGYGIMCRHSTCRVYGPVCEDGHCEECCKKNHAGFPRHLIPEMWLKPKAQPTQEAVFSDLGKVTFAELPATAGVFSRWTPQGGIDVYGW